MGGSRSSRGFRLTCFGLVGLLGLNASALALGSAVPSLLDIAEQLARRPQGAYRDRPGPVFRGARPGRDENRSDWWTPRLRRDLENVRLGRAIEEAAERGELLAALDPMAMAAVIQTSPDGGGSGGGGTAGEGNGGSGGPSTGGGAGAGGVTGGIVGETNTNTGNKLTQVHLLGWNARGDTAVSIGLSHSSRDPFSGEAGTGWSHSYEASLAHTAGSSAIIRLPDGTTLPFEEQTDGSFKRPNGFHAGLVKSATQWTLTFRGSRAQWIFDAAGKLWKVLDRSGNAVTVTRDGSGRTSAVTDATGRATTFAYAADGKLDRISDHTGRIWKFTRTGTNLTQIEYPPREGLAKFHVFQYDTSGRITLHQDRRGQLWQWTYDTTGKILTSKDPLNRTTTYAYTATSTTITSPQGRVTTDNYDQGRLVSRVDPAGFSEAYVYDGDRNVTQRTDARGKIWTATYDLSGDRLTTTNPLGKTWTTAYNTWGQPTSVTSPLGIVRSTTYDGAGRPTAVTDGRGKTTLVSYDSFGQPTGISDPTAKTTTIEYDADGNVFKVTDPAGTAVRRYYDSLSRVTTLRDAANTDTTFTYDSWGQPRFTFAPHGVTSSRLYNSEGQVTTIADNGMGRTTEIAVNGAGEVTGVTNPKGEVESYGYNLDGELTSVTNGRGKVRTYVRSPRGEELTLNHADGTSETRTYLSTGQVASVTNGAGQTNDYTYDDAGRLTFENNAGTTPDVTRTYDHDDRATGMADGTGTTAFTLDGSGNVTGMAAPAGSVSHGYDDAGRELSTTQPGGLTTTNAYDLYGRPSGVTSPSGETSSVQYDALGRGWRTVYGNGTYEERTYDGLSRPLTIVLKSAGGTTLRSESLTYNKASQILTRTVDGVQTSYAYDANGRLTAETAPGRTVSYVWDGSGNRTGRTVNGVAETAAYDDADKLLTVTVGGSTVRSYVYDGAGRATNVTAGGVTTALAWDSRGYATSVGNVTMVTNGAGARTVEGGQALLRDGADVLAPILADGGATYVPGLSERRAGATSYLHGGDKNAEARTSSTGAVTGTRSYDAFGGTLSSTGWQGPAGYGGAFGYREDGTNFRLVGHRLYDPTAGRFLSRDPARDGSNWYAYCEGDPVNAADPEGLEPITLPRSPAELGPGWTRLPHNDPNGGERWLAPGGREGLEFHPGRPGHPSKEQSRDHWHRLRRNKKGKLEKEKEGGKHHQPGDVVEVDTAPAVESPDPQNMWDHFDWNRVGVGLESIITIILLRGGGFRRAPGVGRGGGVYGPRPVIIA